MDLPVELLGMVLQHLSKLEIKQLRQTCKRLAVVSVPFLFDSIFISRDSLDQDYAALALTQFKTSIKKVIASPLKYPKLNRKCHENIVRRIKIRCGLPKHPRPYEHIDLGYREYCSVQERAGDQSLWCKFEDLLQQILMEVPSVYRLVLTHRNRFKEMTDLELAKYCPSETCSLPRQMHAMFRLTPLQGLGKSRSSDIARTAFSILPGRTRKITELVMEPTNSIDGIFKIPIERFDEPRWFTLQVSVLMANLMKLRLDIDDLGDRSCMQQTGALVRFLAQAENLECLALRFRDSNSTGLFCPSRSDCQFLKLRTLVFENVGIPGGELLLLISNAPRLKHIALDGCWMNGYWWIDLLKGIRTLGTLKTLRVSRCFEGFHAPDWEDGDTWNYFADLDKDGPLNQDGPCLLPPHGRKLQYWAQCFDTRLLTRDASPASLAQLFYQEYF